MTADPITELDFDLSAPDGARRVRPTIRLTADERIEMGGLAKLTAHGDSAIEILEEIVKWFALEIQLARASPDLLAIPKAITMVRRTAQVLFNTGYTEMEPVILQINVGLEKVVQVARLGLVRRLLSPKTSEEEAKKIGLCIAELVSAGAWEFDWDEFEAEIARCAHQPSR
jgi:hypothetical protein